MTPLIEIRNLQFSYDDGREVLRGVDFTLYAGECVVVLGANGSGKTTFLLHLNGLLRGKGSVSVCGYPVTDGNLGEIRRRVGFVFQDSDEQLFMPTVLEDVAFGLINLGSGLEEAKIHALAALEQVGMAQHAERAPYHLSAGEKRRVAIAGILAMNPEVLVLDEPTTFIDPPGQRELIELLRNLSQAKVVVTHHTRFAAAIGSRAIFFESGRIVEDGAVPDVVQRRGWDLFSIR